MKCLVILTVFSVVHSTTIYQNPNNQIGYNGPYEMLRKQCPICDSSVYSYCNEKLFHDSCCCSRNPYDQYPQQCSYADCSFLHANTCREHRLITSCCCTNLFFKK